MWYTFKTLLPEQADQMFLLLHHTKPEYIDVSNKGRGRKSNAKYPARFTGRPATLSIGDTVIACGGKLGKKSPRRRCFSLVKQNWKFSGDMERTRTNFAVIPLSKDSFIAYGI